MVFITEKWHFQAFNNPFFNAERWRTFILVRASLTASFVFVFVIVQLLVVMVICINEYLGFTIISWPKAKREDTSLQKTTIALKEWTRLQEHLSTCVPNCKSFRVTIRKKEGHPTGFHPFLTRLLCTFVTISQRCQQASYSINPCLSYGTLSQYSNPTIPPISHNNQNNHNS